jgi:hypothetical protein
MMEPEDHRENRVNQVTSMRDFSQVIALKDTQWHWLAIAG